MDWINHQPRASLGLAAWQVTTCDKLWHPSLRAPWAVWIFGTRWWIPAMGRHKTCRGRWKFRENPGPNEIPQALESVKMGWEVDIKDVWVIFGEFWGPGNFGSRRLRTKIAAIQGIGELSEMLATCIERKLETQDLEWSRVISLSESSWSLQSSRRLSAKITDATTHFVYLHRTCKILKSLGPCGDVFRQCLTPQHPIVPTG